MGRSIKRYIRVAITYFMIAVLALLLSGIIQSMMSAQSEFRGAVSGNAIAVEARDYHGDVRSFCQTLMDNEQCMAIYKVFPYANTKAVWFQDPTQENRPILQGAFFTAELLQSDDRYAIVGKNIYQSEVEFADETPIIYFDMQPYTVVGVLGYDNRSSDYDDTIYVNLSSLMANDKYVADGEYIIDYTQKFTSRFDELRTAVLQGQSPEATITQVAMSKYIPSVTNVLEDSAVVRLLFLSLVMVLFTSFSVTLEWIEKRKKEIAIRKLLGSTTSKITFYLYSRFIGIALLVYVIALPFYSALHPRIMEWLQYPNCTMDALESLWVYLLCVAVSFIGCLPAITSIRKIEPQALVR